MKKKIFTLLFVGSVFNTYAQVLFEEKFDSYQNLTPVENAPIDATAQGSWTFSCTPNNAQGTSPLIYEGSLTYPGYRLSGAGQTLYLNVEDQTSTPGTSFSRNTVCRALTDRTPIKPEDGNAIYTAFMMNFSENMKTAGSDIFCYFRQGSSYTSTDMSTTSTMRGIVRYKIEDDMVSFSIRKSSTTDYDWSLPLDKSQTVLLVVKRICNSTSTSGANDEYMLFVNPDPKKNESDNASAIITAKDNQTGGGADLRHISFRQLGSSHCKVAGISIAKSFEEAVAGNTTGASAIQKSQTSLYVDGDNLFMNFDSMTNVEIFDLNGKKMAVYNVKGTRTIKPMLPNGIFIAKISNENGISESKIRFNQ